MAEVTPAIYSFRPKFEADLRRFLQYLRESDGKSIQTMGHLHGNAFSHLAKQIENAIYSNAIKSSKLSYRSAEKFAWKLGEAIEAHGEIVFAQMQKEEWSWQNVVELGKWLQLGWDIKYYNQG